ncbi:MAG: trypsin-like peptidase domain-containing protein [Acidobacteria bacterium]|nr:trypsin-like peptidase domain-containing protein [Acidobacteriota bacterium]MCI0724729.1 trypsin-like peptidase domain-containing protein [Acidobacteriota bacterium]
MILRLPARFCLLLALLHLPAGLEASNLKDALASVGQILAGDNDRSGNTQVRLEGSGVVVGAEGIVVTNSHVVSEGDRFFSSIYFNLLDPKHPYAPPDRSRLYRVEVLLKNPERDLVLLRIVANADGKPFPTSQTFAAIQLGDSSKLDFLDEIYAVGFPKAGGSTVTITRGQVSGKEELEDWIKTDAQVTHGNSGGAAVTKEGKLIGVPTQVRPDIQPVDTDNDGFPDTSVSFGAVGLIRPVEIVARMLEDARKGQPQAERLEVKGLVLSQVGESIGQALVGLLKAGSREASLENLLTWARADQNGIFKFPLPIPPGEYVIRARAAGYETHLETLHLKQQDKNLLIRLGPAEP